MLEHILFIGRELIAGRWWNIYSDGTRLPLIAGGSDDGDGDGDQGDDGDGDADADKGDAGGDDDDDDKDRDKLGDPGKKALDRMKDQRNTARAQLREWKALGKTPDEIKKLLGGKKPDGADGDQPDAETIREEARAEARREATRDRAVDKIEARAGRTFTIEVDGKKKQMRLLDPEDAVAFLRDKTEDFLDGDTIDTEAIDDALKELIEKKPRLAGEIDGKGKKFDGDADAGARKTERTDKPKSLGAAIGTRLSGGSK